MVAKEKHMHEPSSDLRTRYLAKRKAFSRLVVGSLAALLLVAGVCPAHAYTTLYGNDGLPPYDAYEIDPVLIAVQRHEVSVTKVAGAFYSVQNLVGAECPIGLGFVIIVVQCRG